MTTPAWINPLYAAAHPELFAQGDASENPAETAAPGILVQKSTAQKIPMSTTPLTWGVELEFVFAFHENQLELGEQNDDEGVPQPDVIQKNIPYKFRRDGPGFKNPAAEMIPNRVYNSWGFYNKAAIQNPRHYDNKEVEKILDRVLDEKTPSISHRIDDSIPVNIKTQGMYDQWLIIRDYSVCGVGSKNIPTWLPRMTSKTDWDSYGLELVSPIFNTGSKQGIDEITQILDVVKGTDSDPTGAFITNQCGLHVHVQAPDSLDILKELAVLCVVYEAEISKLHPHCRRPQNPNAEYSIESNRLFFLHSRSNDPSRKTHGDLDVSNETLARQDDGFLDEIRYEIWRCTDAGELALKMNWPDHGLGNELGNRNRQVNFTAAARGKDSPYTIEFRQARGTLDAKDIRMWVEFCVSLVRLAGYYVDNPGTFPMKTFKSFLVDEEKKNVRERFYIMDLMRDMGMSEEDMNYWRERMARFMGKGGPMDRLDNEWEPPHENAQGEGIPGGDGNDDPEYSHDGGGHYEGGNGGNEASGGNSEGGNTGGGNTGGGNTGGGNTGGGNTGGGNTGGGNTGGGSDPPSSGNGGKKDPPKAGDKRPADDDDEDQDGKQAKKQKISPGTIATTGAFLAATTIAAIAAAAAAQAAQAPVIPPNYNDPTPGMLAPVGVFSPNEAHRYTGGVWAVENFDFRRWRLHPTSTFVGNRNFVCSVNALLGSMRVQHPTDSVGNISPVGLLEMFDNVVNRRVYNDASDSELQSLVDRWTGGRYNVVIVSTAYQNGIAYRAETLGAQQRLRQNLYVHHIYDRNGGGGHWEVMRRRPGQ
jgi:hypothetical protein